MFCHNCVGNLTSFPTTPHWPRYLARFSSHKDFRSNRKSPCLWGDFGGFSKISRGISWSLFVVKTAEKAREEPEICWFNCLECFRVDQNRTFVTTTFFDQFSRAIRRWKGNFTSFPMMLNSLGRNAPKWRYDDFRCYRKSPCLLTDFDGFFTIGCGFS